MQQLRRSYIFEFAGMPQSGKTTVIDILVHYLKRMEYPFAEYNGGSRYSPYYHKPIGELNWSLAEQAEKFARSILGSENTDHKIYLLDRGLIDRCIFTDALVQDGKIPEKQAERIYGLLTTSELLDRLDEVFIFITSPETAIEREYQGKLIKPGDALSQGEVMNKDFLLKLKKAAKVRNFWAMEHVKNIELINTEQFDEDMQAIAMNILITIQNRYPELVKPYTGNS